MPLIMPCSIAEADAEAIAAVEAADKSENIPNWENSVPRPAPIALPKTPSTVNSFPSTPCMPAETKDDVAALAAAPLILNCETKKLFNDVPMAALAVPQVAAASTAASIISLA